MKGTQKTPAKGLFKKMYAVIVIALLQTAVLSATVTAALPGFFTQGGGTVSITSVQQKLSNDFATQLFFYPLCNCATYPTACLDASAIFDEWLQAWNQNHNIPVLTIMPYACSNTDDWIVYQIGNGTVDDQVKAWGTLIGSFVRGDPTYSTGPPPTSPQSKRRVYIRPLHEMNGNWYPWGWSSDQLTPPTSFATAFAHFVTVLRHAVVTTLPQSQQNVKDYMQVIFCINSRSAHNNWEPNPEAELWYPGDTFVDWIGIDGYNTPDYVGGQWENVSYIFDTPLQNVRQMAPQKPVGITETGCDDGGNAATFQQKGQWLTEMCTYVKSNGIGQLTYFNVEKEEQGSMHYWGVASTTYAAFQPYPNYYTEWLNCMQESGGSSTPWIFSNASLQGLITDLQFRGGFP